jgi:GT2 family glycosyltransferase
MNGPPLFSVIIPTHHRNDLLARCLDCLAPGVQSLPTRQYEVIVTDDGYQTTAERMIQERYGWAKWVAGPRKGPAANRNNGEKYAKAEWLVFTDDDCLPDRDWLGAYATAIEQSPSCLVFEGRTYVDRARVSLAETAPSNETGGYLWSCNFLINKILFNEIGGFDERFPYAAMEDVDLRLRLTKADYSFSFIKGAAVCHPWRQKGGWKKLKQHQKSVLIYLSINPEEKSKINAGFYIGATLRAVIKSTIPEGIRLRGKGIQESFLEHFSDLQMAFLLAVKTNSKDHGSHLGV